MRKIKEVLRLKFELGFANRQIARSCSINHSTVADYLYRAKAAGLGQWPLPDGLDETSLEKRLFPTVSPRVGQPRAAPNWPAIHEDLHGHKHITLQLVWQEYKQSNPDGTSTAGSVGCISSGPTIWTWSCGRSTAPEKSCSS